MRYAKAVVRLVGVLLFLSLSMYGSTPHETFINIVDPVTVAGKQPARGEYKVEWSVVGLSSQVTFSKDGRIAVATASVRDRSNPCGGPAVAAGPAGNGRKVLEAIDLPKQAIILRAGRDDTEVTL